MTQTFDKSLLDTFQKVIEESLLGFIKKNNITTFQELVKDGMNAICITLQQRLLEHIDKGLVSDPTRRKDWVIVRRNDVKTILSFV